jgi:hypothetical protein
MRFYLALIVTTLLARACGDAAGQRTQLSLQVDPQSEVCFFESLAAGDSAEATVLVYRGGKLDIGLRIEGPLPADAPAVSGALKLVSSRSAAPAGPVLYERLLFSNLDDRSGQPLPTIVKKGFSFVASGSGVFGFCLNNKMAKCVSRGPRGIVVCPCRRAAR